MSPAQWYGDQVVGLNTLKKVIQTIAENANLHGFFTNHSLRHTGTCCSFQAAVDRRFIKEFTGHPSDAVDKYQVTSHEQCKKLSAVISGENCDRNKGNNPGDLELSVGQTESAMACARNKKI